MGIKKEAAETLKSKLDDIAKAYTKEEVKDIKKGVFKEGMGGVWGDAWDNLKSVGGGGQYIEGAVKGALAMGAVGGVTEWSQGGSFWSGASSSALNGAILGAGARAVKVGAHGANWDKGMWRDVPGKYSGMYESKALTAIKRNEETVRAAKNATGTK